jgi:hypothetical protein
VASVGLCDEGGQPVPTPLCERDKRVVSSYDAVVMLHASVCGCEAPGCSEMFWHVPVLMHMTMQALLWRCC